jgi:hypothetical protein
MNRLVTILIFLSFMPDAHAQKDTCTWDDLLHVKGSWKRMPDYMLYPGKNYLPAMKTEIFKRLGKMQEIMMGVYTPSGMEAAWQRQVIGTATYTKAKTVAYSIWGQLLEYRCDSKTHKPYLEDESGNHYDFFVNNFSSAVNYDTSMRIGKYYVALLPSRVGSLKGVDLFQYSLVRGNERCIIISRDGQLPYTPLTRKQFLTALKEKLLNEVNHYLGQNAQNAKTEAEKLKVGQYWKSHYDPKIKTIDDYLNNHSEEDLAQTAFVKNIYEFQQFYSEKEGGKMPIIVNGDYFHLNQTPYFPQFITVYWEWDDGEGPGGGLLAPVPPDMNVCCRVSKHYKESIEQNLDVEAIRQLLDQ